MNCVLNLTVCVCTYVVCVWGGGGLVRRRISVSLVVQLYAYYMKRAGVYGNVPGDR